MIYSGMMVILYQKIIIILSLRQHPFLRLFPILRKLATISILPICFPLGQFFGLFYLFSKRFNFI